MSHVTLTWLLPDGRAGATLPDGTALRVDGGLPGDRIEPAITATRGRTADATVGAVVVPSPHRRTPACPWSDRCGGCDLGGADPAARLDWLGAMLGHAFGRPTPVEVVASPRQTGHRARITLHFAEGAVGYRAARSHALVPIDRCGIARPEVDAGFQQLRALLAETPGAFVGLTDVEVRTDGTRTVFVFEGRSAAPEGLKALGNVVVGGKTLAGTPHLSLAVGGIALRAGPRAFYQVNLEGNALMGEFVRSTVRASGAERVLDLYAGIGNLSLPLAAAGVPVVAVEAPGPGAEDLRHNARPYGAEVLALPVERFDPSRTPFDAVILDPPRAGAPGVLERVARNRPKLVVYVSCHAPSAARDVASLRGYTLTEVRGFDLFPDTHHVESVLVLRR